MFFISFIFPAPDGAHCHFEPLWKTVCVYLCVCVSAPGSCWVCVLSLSLVSPHNSQCSYLKWPEPHQQIKESSPACHAAPSLCRVVCLLSNWDAPQSEMQVTRWKNLHIRRKKKINLLSLEGIFFEAQPAVQSCHFGNLWWTVRQSFVLCQEMIFQDTSRTSVTLFEGILSFSKVCHHCDWSTAVAFNTRHKSANVMWCEHVF